MAKAGRAMRSATQAQPWISNSSVFFLKRPCVGGSDMSSRARVSRMRNYSDDWLRVDGSGPHRFARRKGMRWFPRTGRSTTDQVRPTGVPVLCVRTFQVPRGGYTARGTCVPRSHSPTTFLPRRRKTTRARMGGPAPSLTPSRCPRPPRTPRRSRSPRRSPPSPSSPSSAEHAPA